MTKRVVVLLAWLVSLWLAYLAGSWREAEVSPAVVPVPAAASDDNPLGRDRFQILLDLQSWQALATWADQSGAGERLIRQAHSLAQSGRQAEALSLLSAYVELAPSAVALFALSDVLLMNGRPVEALEPLLQILDYPPSAEQAVVARQRLDLIINAHEQQLVNTDDLAGLVSFFTLLSEREPGFDGHRLALARWLMQSGELEAARGLFREIGYVGVDPDQLEALERELVLADSQLPFEREGRAIYAQASARGRSGEGQMRLLVDTGATTTSLSRQVLARLDAEPLGTRVRVNTASGITVLEGFRVRNFRVGNLELRELPVLALESSPGGADGLLGMDVLDRLLK